MKALTIWQPWASLIIAGAKSAPDFADSDRIDHQKFAWPLTDIEKFEPPIPARGAQGFWHWSEARP